MGVQLKVTNLYLSPVRTWCSNRTRYIVGSLMQPLSSCIEILARIQHVWPLAVPNFISSHSFRFCSIAETNGKQSFYELKLKGTLLIWCELNCNLPITRVPNLMSKEQTTELSTCSNTTPLKLGGQVPAVLELVQTRLHSNVFEWPEIVCVRPYQPNQVEFKLSTKLSTESKLGLVSSSSICVRTQLGLNLVGELKCSNSTWFELGWEIQTMLVHVRTQTSLNMLEHQQSVVRTISIFYLQSGHTVIAVGRWHSVVKELSKYVSHSILFVICDKNENMDGNNLRC